MTHTTTVASAAYPRTDRYLTLECLPSLTDSDSDRRISSVYALGRSSARSKKTTGTKRSARVSHGVPINHVAKPNKSDRAMARNTVPARIRRRPSGSSISAFLTETLAVRSAMLPDWLSKPGVDTQISTSFDSLHVGAFVCNRR